MIDPRRALARLKSFARAHTAALLSGVLLAIMALQMFAVIWRKSITIDEVVMIPAAYYHLVAGNYQLVNEHPALAKIVAGLPLLFVQPNEASPDQIHDPPGTAEAKWAYQAAIWDKNVDRFEPISFWPRVAMICLTLALGVLIFRFGRELFGDRAAVIAVGLFALEPTFLAHGRVVQTDVPAAFGYLLFFVALYYFNRKPTWRLAIWLGAATAIAVLAKFSMLLVGPVLLAFFIVKLWRSGSLGRRRILMLGALALMTVVVVINGAYFFQRPALMPAEIAWISEPTTRLTRFDLSAVKFLSVMLPKDFVLGILFQLRHNGSGHWAGLLGMHSQKGWWYYFPVAFALKATLPFLVLSLTALAWGTYQILKRRAWFYLWLIVPFLLYTVFVLFSHINIGVRYYLPAYPFLIILGAGLLDQLLKFTRARAVAVALAVALLGWITIEAVRAFPHHMSYMNQLASGAPHWWYLSDSNVEWGDDVRLLAAELRTRGETRVVDATLGGWATLRFYGIERVEPLAATQPENPPQYIAIGASYLNGSTVPFPPGRNLTDAERVNFFSEYRQRVPEAVIGGSIYLYRQIGH